MPGRCAPGSRRRAVRRGRPARTLIQSFLLLAAALAPAALAAQERPTLTPADYGRWETPGPAVLTPDGAWMAYRVWRVNEEHELRLRTLAAGAADAASGDSARVVPWGEDPEFSANSRWLAYAIGMSEEERERLEEADEPVRTGAGVIDLRRGEQRSFDEVRAFAFDADGRFLALHGYPPEEPEGKGADLRLLDLERGTSTTFGNVAEFAWSDSASLIALTIATGSDHGNGVQVYDAATGRLRALDSSSSTYTRLAWRENAPDLAVLRSREPGGDRPTPDAEEEDAEEEDEQIPQDVLAWRDLDSETPSMFMLAEGATGIADTLVVLSVRAPVWSDDGMMISIGLRPEVPEVEGGETAAEGEEGPQDVAPNETDDDDTDEPDSADGDDDEDEPELPGVQIWHTSDVRIFPQQKTSKSRDARRTLLAVWHLDDERVVQIGTHLLGSARLLEGWKHAVEDVEEPYPWGAMFGRPYHDVWVVDVETGTREKRLERVRYAWPSDGGRWLLSFDGENYTSHDLETGLDYDLTSGLDATFADTTYDTPTDLLPPFGFRPGGWIERDAAVLLYDQYDVWKVAPDGSDATRLTDGTAERVVHRIAFDPDDETPGLDPDDPIYLSLHGAWSEKRGYARAMPDGSLETLLFRDKFITGLVKADSSDVYMYREMAFDDPTDYFVAGPDLADAQQVTEMNPFFEEYAWGRAELVDFTSESGRPLQSVLYYPANYEEGTRVPTIVYTYEMLSPGIHRFRVPSEPDYYNVAAWTQQGYAVLQPDIVYRARDPGISALEAVRAAVAKVVDLGVVDPEAVGLIGHSWGGYQAAYLPTRTDIFAASVAGAPLTDFVSFMGAIHWNAGLPELDHWETGQARMEVPFWEDPQAHRRNSPIHGIDQLETPILMAFGNEDGVVDWDQGTEFYNFARRAGKQMVLLVYEGEDHGFRQEPNQVDYHRRILEWFGHYLKGEPAPAWITDGVKLQDLEEEKRRLTESNDDG